MPNPRGRRPGSGIHDGQRYSIRLSQELSQRLNDRARGRADFQSNLQGTDRTHADSQPGGHVSDIIRESIEHYLNGCDRELRVEPKPTAPKRTRTPARAAKG
jgi:predicted DNA-binding protein